MSCTAFSLIIAYIVLLPLLLLFVRVRAVHAKGDPLDLRSLLGKPDRMTLAMSNDLCIVSHCLGECATSQLASSLQDEVSILCITLNAESSSSVASAHYPMLLMHADLLTGHHRHGG